MLVASALAGLAGCLGEDDDGGNGDEQNDTGNGNGEENGTENGNENENASEENDSDTDNETDDGGESDFGPVGELTVSLENEDGQPVSEGVEVVASRVGESVSHATSDISEGQAVIELYDEGDYTVTVESLSDEFDPVEETVTFDGDQELTVVLEGATGDGDEGEGQNESEEDGGN